MNLFVTLREARGKGRERTSSAEPTTCIILRTSAWEKDGREGSYSGEKERRRAVKEIKGEW